MKELTPEQRDLLRRVHLHYASEELLDDPRPIRKWGVSAGIRDWDEETGEESVTTIAVMQLVYCHLGEADVLDALDEESGDLLTVGTGVIDVETDDIVEELGTHTNLLIVDSVSLANEWRGYGVGAYLTGRAIQALSPGCSLAALYPSPTDGAERTKAQTNAARAKIGKGWERLGFEHFRDNVYVLDLSFTTLDRAVDTLAKQLL